MAPKAVEKLRRILKPAAQHGAPVEKAKRMAATVKASPSNDTTWRAPVSSTVAVRRASEQTWIMESADRFVQCRIGIAGGTSVTFTRTAS